MVKLSLISFLSKLNVGSNVSFNFISNILNISLKNLLKCSSGIVIDIPGFYYCLVIEIITIAITILKKIFFIIKKLLLLLINYMINN